MDDLSRFCCQNSDCRDYGRRGGENLTVCGRFGEQGRIRLLYCRTCKARFSERKGTALFHIKLADERSEQVLAHLAEGCGVRQTSRLVGVHATPSRGWRAGLALTPGRCTTNGWLFPPETHEVQLDEKWAFIGKKQKHCHDSDPADDRLGDCWDHVALDAEHRLVLGVVPGKRTAENVQALVDDMKRRTGGRMLNLITTDECAPYEQAILNAHGRTVTPPRTGRRGRPRSPYKIAPPDLRYATVHKTRHNARVIKIDYRAVFGEPDAIEQALGRSTVSEQINTAFVERQNGTDRHRNARKVRKTYRFSKDPDVHRATTYFSLYSYNFCWPVRTLRQRDSRGRWHPRTPALAAGLTDHVWPLAEWLSMPAVQRE